MQIKPQHINASLDERLRQLLQTGNLPRNATPLVIEDDYPDDFEVNTPDGAAFGLQQWDALTKHEINAARKSSSSQDSGAVGDKTAGPSPAETTNPAMPGKESLTGADNES